MHLTKITRGPLRSKAIQAQASVFDQLEKVKLNFPGVIPESADGSDEYAMAHALNVPDVHNAKQWKKAECIHGEKLNKPMREHYITKMFPSLLRSSQ